MEQEKVKPAGRRLVIPTALVGAVGGIVAGLTGNLAAVAGALAGAVAGGAYASAYLSSHVTRSDEARRSAGRFVVGAGSRLALAVAAMIAVWLVSRGAFMAYLICFAVAFGVLVAAELPGALRAIKAGRPAVTGRQS
jgi:MFS family permease